MSQFDENLVREYFELNGFFVRQLSRYAPKPKKRMEDGLLDLLMVNPTFKETNSQLGSFQLFAGEVALLPSAYVVIKGWRASKFTPATLKSNARTLDFIKKEVVGKATSLFDLEEPFSEEFHAFSNYKRILVLPHLPTSDPQRSECIRMLQDCGVEGVITFGTILEKILRSVDVTPSYQRSDLLQLVRVLKIYDMIRQPQLQLFGS